MLSSFKKFFKRNNNKSTESYTKKSLLLVAFTNILQDVLFWNNLWLSLIFILYFHVTFFALFYRQFNILQTLCVFFIFVVCIDATETWLKYKHRTNCLKKLAQSDNKELAESISKIYNGIQMQMKNFVELREKNPTKAFLLMQIILGMIFCIGACLNGYILTYHISMIVIFLNKLIPPLKRILKRIQQTAESDVELESLMPDASAENINLLSIEPEVQTYIDEKQSLDYWKPEDVPLEDASSDTSDNSSSLVTNLSIEKLHNMDQDIEGTDSSDEEYIPKGQDEKFRTTMEVQPVASWSNSAYNVISTLGGAVSNIVYSPNKENKRSRIPSMDSSDGFEIVDKNDLM